MWMVVEGRRLKEGKVNGGGGNEGVKWERRGDGGKLREILEISEQREGNVGGISSRFGAKRDCGNGGTKLGKVLVVSQGSCFEHLSVYGKRENRTVKTNCN